MYVVLQCGSVSKEILVFPKTTTGNVPLNPGKHCYLVNNSSTSLYVETIVYGNVNTEKSSEKMIDETVPAMSVKQFNTISLDYFFEAQDKTIQTKLDGELKYKVSCAK